MLSCVSVIGLTHSQLTPVGERSFKWNSDSGVPAQWNLQIPVSPFGENKLLKRDYYYEEITILTMPAFCHQA